MGDIEALTVPAAGWYPDRNEANTLRWWDGQQWTDQTQSTAPAAAAFEQPVSAAAFGTVTAATTTPGVAPGWYPDNYDPSINRWWDGTQWTTHTAPAGPVVPQPSVGSVGSFGAEPVSSVHNTMATLALIFSLVSFAGLIFAPLLALSLAGIITGGVALRRAPRFAPGARRRGQAVAGIVVGAVSLIATVLLTVSAFLVSQQVHSTTGSQLGSQQASPQNNGGVFFPSTVAEMKGVIATSIQRQDSVVVTAVSCDAAASMVSGSVFECGVTVTDGRWLPVRVNIEYPTGTGMAYGVSSGPLLAHDTAAPIQNYTLDQITRELTIDLSQAWRSRVMGTDCEPTASTATGSTFRCVLALDGGRTGGVLITMVQPGGFDVTVTQPPPGSGSSGGSTSGGSGTGGSGSDGGGPGESTDPEPDPDLSNS